MHEPMRTNEAMESFGGLAAASGTAAVAGKGKGLLAAFSITERKGQEKPFWNKVGVAYFNRDGSINVYLDALPLQGKLQLREERDRPATARPQRQGPAAEEG
jgi:hypothetical protein